MHDRSYWGFAAISIVLASWILFRYLRPRGGREWTRAGVLQAFLIAFYAEMYGFPVTLYALTRLFGLDLGGSLWRGNLWAYLTGSENIMLASMLVGYTVAAVGLMLLAIGWRQIHRGVREQRLVTDGLYAHIRHPQYTGLFLAVFGEGVIHWPTVFSLAAFPIIVVAYALLAQREERQMMAHYGGDYADYRLATPMFIPRMRAWRDLGRTIGPGARRSPPS